MTKIYLLQEMYTDYFIGKVWAFSTRSKRDKAQKKLAPFYQNSRSMLYPINAEIDGKIKNPNVPEYDKEEVCYE